MMSRTASSAWSRRFMNAPVSGLSAGISASASQRPVDVPEQVVLHAHVGVEGGEVEGRGNVAGLGHPIMLVSRQRAQTSEP